MTLPLPTDRDGWCRRVLGAAPRVPPSMLSFLSAALADPRAGSDALLWMADALEEAAQIAHASGRTVTVQELRALADLPRQLAPHRAEQERLEISGTNAGADDRTVAALAESDGTTTVDQSLLGRLRGAFVRSPGKFPPRQYFGGLIPQDTTGDE